MKKIDFWLDISGETTGVSINHNFLVVVGTTLVLYLSLAFLDPLKVYGPNASKALGFLLASVFFMVFSSVPLAIIAMLVAVLGTMIGLFDWATVSGKLGSSAFYQALGMMIVSMGCEFTNFGYRIGYKILKKFGNRPIRLIISITVITALLSTVISNVAVLIMMSSITNSLLLTKGEKPGESNMGKAAMLCIAMGSMAGGMGLFTGSPIGNASILSYMTAALGGQDYSPTFTQWAIVSFPTLMICIVPMSIVYIRYFKVSNRNTIELPESYYDQCLKELGPMSGAEWRWVLMVILMILTMFLGMNTAYAAMFFAAVSMFPGIGVSDSKQVLKRIPWNPLIAICMLPLMGEVIVGSGISDWLCILIAPVFDHTSPFTFALICSLVLSILMNLMVNSMQASMALIMSVAAPICVRLGYNPTIVLLPTAMAASYMWAFGVNQYVIMSKEYGWWEMKDTIIPGIISVLIPAVMGPVVAYLVGPLAGMPLYL